jgi:hypothetical protein
MAALICHLMTARLFRICQHAGWQHTSRQLSRSHEEYEQQNAGFCQITQLRKFTHFVSSGASYSQKYQQIVGRQFIPVLGQWRQQARKRYPIHRFNQCSSFKRRRNCALTATMMVERFIAIAPTLIGRSSPQRINIPPAAGMAIKL